MRKRWVLLRGRGLVRVGLVRDGLIEGMGLSEEWT